MTVAFLFPGQGAQYPGMLRDLPDHPAVRDTIAEASDILGQNASALDGESSLKSTASVQLAILTAGVATARALEAEGARPDGVAGLSIGAFPAAVVCGALEFSAAVPIVKLRGELMQGAYPSGFGLATLLGLDERRVRAIVEEIATPHAPLHVANVNAPRQIVIAGADPALDLAITAACSAGAHKAKRLTVTVPSHCPLLSSVADQLLDAMANVTIRSPRVPYISNRAARALLDPEAIRQDLATNVAHPVRWHDATTVLFELGVRLFVEMPPGDVLTRLAHDAFPDARTVAVAPSGFASALALIRRQVSTGR